MLLFLLVLVILIGCGTDENVDEKDTVVPISDQTGIVSGTVIDSNTANPIVGAIVNILDSEVKTEVDGTYTLNNIPYAENLSLTIQDPRYETYNHTFTLKQERHIINAELISLIGTVSGTVTDADTGNPIPGAVVRLMDKEVKTEADGIFTLYDNSYVGDHILTVEDPDYQSYTHTFTLEKARLVLKVELTPLYNSEDELNVFLEDFSDLIETLDFEKLPDIQALFSETYVASDDPVTLLGILSGVVPTHHETIIPTFENVFQTYSWLQFAFKERMMDITHARKASIELLLDVDSEKAEDKTLRQLEAKCIFEFRREDTDWKIVYWQLLNLDIRL